MMVRHTSFITFLLLLVLRLGISTAALSSSTTEHISSSLPRLLQTSRTSNEHKRKAFSRFAFVVPILSVSIMAWAVRKHKLCLCCGDDEIPDEIVVPRGDDSILGGESTKATEMQPPHYWKRYHAREKDRNKNSKSAVSSLRQPDDVSSLNTSEEDYEDDSTTNGFVLMVA